jgi:hypothetical protein
LFTRSSLVLRIFVRAVSSWMRRRARTLGTPIDPSAPIPRPGSAEPSSQPGGTTARVGDHEQTQSTHQRRPGYSSPAPSRIPQRLQLAPGQVGPRGRPKQPCRVGTRGEAGEARLTARQAGITLTSRAMHGAPLGHDGRSHLMRLGQGTCLSYSSLRMRRPVPNRVCSVPKNSKPQDV